MIRSALSRRAAALMIAALLAVSPALAAGPVFPTGSRLGLEPPGTMQPGQGFLGFQDRANKTAILMSAVPKANIAAMTASATPEALEKQGIKEVSRETLTSPFGKGTLIIGEQTVKGTALRKYLLLAEGQDLGAVISIPVPHEARDTYSDAVIRKALATLTSRPSVPEQEQLSMLPFKLDDLAGFNIGHVLPGRGVLLTDAKTPAADGLTNPRIGLTAIPGTPPPNDDRDLLARRLFQSLPDIQIQRVTGAEPLRMGRDPGFQILATAKDPKTDTDLTVIQWVRFGAGGLIHMVGTAPTKQWPEAYSRFRKVRDGVDIR